MLQGPVSFDDADRVGITAFYQMHGKFNNDTEIKDTKKHTKNILYILHQPKNILESLSKKLVGTLMIQ